MPVSGARRVDAGAYIAINQQNPGGSGGLFADMLQEAMAAGGAPAQETAAPAPTPAPATLRQAEMEAQAAALNGAQAEAAAQQNTATNAQQTANGLTGGQAGELIASMLASGETDSESMLMMLMLALAAQDNENSAELNAIVSSLAAGGFGSNEDSLSGMMGGLPGAGGLTGGAAGDTSGMGALTDITSGAKSQALSAAMGSLMQAYSAKGESGINPKAFADLLASAPGMPAAGTAAPEDVPEVTLNETAPLGNNVSPGRELDAPLTSTVNHRDPGLYRSVIDQFSVENNYRYAVNKKGTGDTYCNIFLWDVTRAMGAEIPHHTDPVTGVPLTSRDSQAMSMNANRISDWLQKHGPSYGWHEVTPEQAQALANKGSPAVTVWKNENGKHGHVQVVSPSRDGGFDSSRGVAIAQAGRNLRNYTYITNIYSSLLPEVKYYAHR